MKRPEAYVLTITTKYLCQTPEQAMEITSKVAPRMEEGINTESMTVAVVEPLATDAPQAKPHCVH